MKKIIFLAILLITAIYFHSCGKKPIPQFEPELIIGTWQNDSLFYRYDADGTGVTWDSSDDVSEEEANPFRWTINDSNLLIEYILWTGAIAPKSYTLVTLTNEILEYEDHYDQMFHFVKAH